MAFVGILTVLMLGIVAAFIIKYFVPLLIIGTIGAAGAVLFIAALVRRSRAEKRGLRKGNAMLISGIILTLLSPVCAVGLFMRAFVIPK